MPQLLDITHPSDSVNTARGAIAIALETDTKSCLNVVGPVTLQGKRVEPTNRVWEVREQINNNGLRTAQNLRYIKDGR